MTMGLDSFVAAAFVVFCRVGACIMTMPGFSAQPIPARVRLFVAIGLSLALMLPLYDAIAPLVNGAPPSVLALALLTETAVGALIGLMARLFFFALETLGTAAVTAMGVGNVLSAPIDEAEPLPAMTSFVVLSAVTLLFVTDLHWEIIRGLFMSYSAIPILKAPPAQTLLSEYMKVIGQAFVLALRISSPLLLFGLLANIAFGLLNKMAPHVPVYFVSAPLLIALAVYWFYLMGEEFFAIFTMDIGSWLRSG